MPEHEECDFELLGMIAFVESNFIGMALAHFLILDEQIFAIYLHQVLPFVELLSCTVSSCKHLVQAMHLQSLAPNQLLIQL